MLAFVSCAALAEGPASSPYDKPGPSHQPPYTWPNQQGRTIECTASPWQVVDLGKIGPVRIYAGDHCSMPMADPLSEHYKKLFSDSCDLHDICYFEPGNTKGYCDGALLWRMERDCDRAHPEEPALWAHCRATAEAWHIGLKTPISTTYWDRSQAWGRANCTLGPAPAK